MTVCDKTIMKFVKMADPDVPWVPKSTLLADYPYSHFNFQPGYFALVKTACNPNSNICCCATTGGQFSFYIPTSNPPPPPPPPHCVLISSHCSCVSPFFCMGITRSQSHVCCTYTSVFIFTCSDFLKASRTLKKNLCVLTPGAG